MLEIGKVVPACPIISVYGPVGEVDLLQTMEPDEFVSAIATGIVFLQIV